MTDPLFAEHQKLRQQAKDGRREAKRTEGRLSAAFRDAMLLWDKQKAAGGTLATFIVGLEALLRDVWPKGECRCPRCFTLCRYCDDTGAIYEKRPARIYSGRMVEVVVPCSCSKGILFQPKAPRSAEDFIAAGRSKPKPKGFERFGK